MTMVFAMPFEFMLPVLLVFALLIFMILRTCMLPMRGTKGPRCGQCGYAYSGWDTCPECGVLVAHAGISTPHLALRLRGSVLGATLAIATLGMVAGILAWRFGIEMLMSRGYLETTETKYFAPRGGYGRIPPYHIVATRSAVLSQGHIVRDGELVIVVVPTAAPENLGTVKLQQVRVGEGNVVLRIQLPSGAQQLIDSKGNVLVRSTEPDLAMAKQLLAIPSISVPQPTLDATAQSILDIATLAGTDAQRNWHLIRSNNIAGELDVIGDLGISQSVASPLRISGLSGLASWTVLMACATTFVSLCVIFVVTRRRVMLLKPPRQSSSMNRPTNNPPQASL